MEKNTSHIEPNSKSHCFSSELCIIYECENSLWKPITKLDIPYMQISKFEREAVSEMIIMCFKYREWFHDRYSLCGESSPRTVLDPRE